MTFARTVISLFEKYFGTSKVESPDYPPFEEEGFFVETADGYIPFYDLQMDAATLGQFQSKRVFGKDGPAPRSLGRFYCRQCGGEGREGISVKVGTGLLIPAEQNDIFWDEQDIYHQHSDAVVRQSFTCETGIHTWTEDFWHRECWCGWKSAGVSLYEFH